MQSVEHIDEGELDQFDRLAQDFADAHAAVEEKLVVLMDAGLELAQGADAEPLALAQIGQVEGDLLERFRRDDALGVAVDGHRKRRPAVDDRVLAAQDQFSWRNGFHVARS